MSLGRWALVFGVAAMAAFARGVSSVGPTFATLMFLGVPLGLVAVALGIWGMTRDRAHRGSAIGGLVLGALAVVLYFGL